MRTPLLGKAVSIGYLLALALFATDLAFAQRVDCPQPRFTGKAPDEYYSRVNPVTPSDAAAKAAAAIFLGTARGGNCSVCHGKNGDGKGPLASQYDPPPRNFSCAKTVADVPDGQLFWIIRFGSPGAAMPPHPSLSDEQIWNLVLYLRKLAK